MPSDEESIWSLKESVILKDYGLEGIWNPISDKAAEKCRMRMGGKGEVAVVLLNESGRLLGKSRNTEAITG